MPRQQILINGNQSSLRRTNQANSAYEQPTKQVEAPVSKRTSLNSLNGYFISQTSTQNVISINGQLQYNKNKKITTNVFEGISSGRKVAVKIDQGSKIDREIQFLSTLDHQNILRFIFSCSLSEGQKVLISEFYDRPLSECSKLQIDVKLIMHQLTSAVECLHRNKILHLDVSPANIFFVKRDVEYVVKLTNYDKAQKNVHGCVQVATFDHNFSAPEILTKLIAFPSSDIWSLGKVFIFIMLQMGHGRDYHQKGKKSVTTTIDINRLKNDSNDIILCKNMLEKIFYLDPKLRLSIEKILEHPFFWSASRIRDFILDIAIMLEGSNNDFRTEIFHGSQKVIGGKNSDWTSRISNKLLEEIKKARQAFHNRTKAFNDDIDGKKITSLITVIRNMIVHTRTAEVIEIVGNDDEAFIKYWTSRFPNLILHLLDAKIRYEEK